MRGRVCNEVDLRQHGMVAARQLLEEMVDGLVPGTVDGARRCQRERGCRHRPATAAVTGAIDAPTAARRDHSSGMKISVPASIRSGLAMLLRRAISGYFQGF